MNVNHTRNHTQVQEKYEITDKISKLLIWGLGNKILEEILTPEAFFKILKHKKTLKQVLFSFVC